MNILVLAHADPEIQNTFFTPRVLRELSDCGNVSIEILSREAAKTILPKYDVLMGSWGMPKLDRDFLESAERLRLVAYTGGSVADLMTEAVPERGIRLLSGNRLYAASVAEGTIGYMLLAQRKMFPILCETREKGWAASCRTDGLRGKKVGIIGFGMIAKELAKMLPVFGCSVLIASDWYREEDIPEYGAAKATVDEIFETCDIITLHESLRTDTFRMIDKKLFSRMKDDALFVNTARGPIISEDDLAREAASGRIRAVLDVYDREPLPMDSPLRACENILLMPHRGGPTTDVRELVTLDLIRDIKVFAADPKASLSCEISWEYARHMTHESLKSGL